MLKANEAMQKAPDKKRLVVRIISAVLMLCFGLFCFMKTDDSFIMYI